MAGCAFIKPAGERCGASAMRGYDHCYNHRPDLADERRRNASKGGKSGGRGRPASAGEEVREIKRHLKSLAAGVLSEDGERKIHRADAAVCGQLLNGVLRAVELERKVREQDELLERLEALEAALESERERGRGGQRWGA